MEYLRLKENVKSLEMEILSLKKKMKKPAGKLERAKYIFFFILVSDLWALAKMNKLVYYVNIPKRIVTLLYPSINMVFTFLLFLRQNTQP